MDNRHLIPIAYGRGTISLYADTELARWQVIRPKFEPALADAHAVFLESCRKPIGCPPLRDIIHPGDRVVVVTSDGTRAVPNRSLIPWLLEELPVPAAKITVLLGNGTHRDNSPAEIADMFGEEVIKRVKIVNHDAFDLKRNECVGQTPSGAKVYLDKLYLEADKRIVVGFIEPHFFAGFSGGAKGIVPGVAGIDTILHIHRTELIAHPMSTWGTLRGNPIHDEIAEMVRFRPPDFMVNVTLNSEKEITGFFVGDYEEAHRHGCQHVKRASMVPVPHAYPIVVTSNSGYPLDQNLYQTVKGISAAARILEEGGAIFMASECCDGIPDHGNFAKLMRIGSSPGDILQYISGLKQTLLDQWEAQILAEILQKAKVALFSKIDRATIEAFKMMAVDDLQQALREHIGSIGTGVEVAVLPDGPLTIPYISSQGE